MKIELTEKELQELLGYLELVSKDIRYVQRLFDKIFEQYKEQKLEAG